MCHICFYSRKPSFFQLGLVRFRWVDTLTLDLQDIENYDFQYQLSHQIFSLILWSWTVWDFLIIFSLRLALVPCHSLRIISLVSIQLRTLQYPSQSVTVPKKNPDTGAYFWYQFFPVPVPVLFYIIFSGSCTFFSTKFIQYRYQYFFR